MSDKCLALDNQQHELKLGASFDPKSRVAFHSIRYDFKPASVDTSQEAQVEIGEGHHVTLTVPHVEGSGKTHTVYKGNKRPVSKECVLIIDHDTGTFTLERLSNNVNVKKTRNDSSSKVQHTGRPVTPVDPKLKSSPNKLKSSQNSPAPAQVPAKQPSPTINTPVTMPKRLEEQTSVIGEISDSSSDSDSLSSDSSDSEDDHDDKVSAAPPVPMTVTPQKPITDQHNKQKGLFMITADLQLSSDSDSD